MQFKATKIEINIDQLGDWEIFIDGKKIISPKRFSVDLFDNKNIQPTYSLEYYANIDQN